MDFKKKIPQYAHYSWHIFVTFSAFPKSIFSWFEDLEVPLASAQCRAAIPLSVGASAHLPSDDISIQHTDRHSLCGGKIQTLRQTQGQI